MTRLYVRSEAPGDVTAIRFVNRLAFGRDDEADLVDALRDGHHTVVSVVALADDDVVGHTLFSRLSLDGEGSAIEAVALGPVAVLPEFQKKGAGTDMITFGLGLCREAGIGLALVLGEPVYYRRFGFSTELAKNLDSPYSGDYFMALWIDEDAARSSPPVGEVRYPPPFW